MRRWGLPLLFLLPLLCQAQAQGRIDCNVLKSSVLHEAVRYCVMLPSNYDSAAAGHPPLHFPVLYFLHGLGDNEQTFVKSGGWELVEDLREQGKISNFLIVVPEGKRSFYINSADGRVHYSDFFIREFIPFIESHYSIRRERSARGISGVSMGGYGALRFAFAYPELFSSVSAESPALIPVAKLPPPGAKMEPGSPLNGSLGEVFGNPFDLRHWKQNSPFALAKQNRALIRSSKLSIYFNCGDDDDFGFEKGAEELDRQLTSEDIKHEFRLYPGDHSAAYFLSHLGETLMFHSRAFGRAK